MSEEVLSTIDIESVEGEELVFRGLPSQWPDFQSGDIIIADVTEKTPYGLLRKIESTQQNGNRLILQTKDATLEEAVINAEVSYLEPYEKPWVLLEGYF